MILIVTQMAWVDLILIQNALIFISHNTKQLIIHRSLLQTRHKIFLLHEINDSIT